MVKISFSTDVIHRLITASVRCDIPSYYMQLCEKAERLICMKSMEVVNVLLLTELGFYMEKKPRC